MFVLLFGFQDPFSNFFAHGSAHHHFSGEDPSASASISLIKENYDHLGLFSICLIQCLSPPFFTRNPLFALQLLKTPTTYG
jgi:hypothetical protein